MFVDDEQSYMLTVNLECRIYSDVTRTVNGQIAFTMRVDTAVRHSCRQSCVCNAFYQHLQYVDSCMLCACVCVGVCVCVCEEQQVLCQ